MSLSDDFPSIPEMAKLVKEMAIQFNQLQDSHQKLREKIEMYRAENKELRGRVEQLEGNKKAEAA